jgi:hypothetical protein
MGSARKHWGVDTLWNDFHYWKHREEQARRYPGKFGARVREIDIITAHERARASFNVLANRKPGLRDPDTYAQLVIEQNFNIGRQEGDALRRALRDH